MTKKEKLVEVLEQFKEKICQLDIHKKSLYTLDELYRKIDATIEELENLR